MNSTDCILEVDLEYPKKLCELHNDYPLAPVQKYNFSKDNFCLIINKRLPIFIIFLLALLKNWCLTFLIKKVCASL